MNEVPAKTTATMMRLLTIYDGDEIYIDMYHIYIYIYIHINICTQMSAHMYIVYSIHACIHVYIYAYIYVHTYIYIYIYSEISGMSTPHQTNKLESNRPLRTHTHTETKNGQPWLAYVGARHQLQN